MSAADYIDLLAARARLDRAAWTHALQRLRRPALARPCRSSRRAIAPLRRERRRRSSPPTACCCATRRCVNLLDGCALRLPCHARRRAAGRPDGLERRAARRRRARRRRSRSRPRCADARRADAMRVAVIGAGIDRRHDRLRAAPSTATRSRCSSAAAASRPRRSFANAGAGRAGLRHAVGGAGHAGQGAAPPVRPRTRRCGCARPLDAATLGWLWRWWRACQPAAPTRPTGLRMHRLAHFSRERLHELTRAPAPRLRARAGLPRAAAHAARPGAGRAGHARRWPSSASRSSVLDAAQCRAIEPGPERRRRRCTPASTLPDDEVGNCRAVRAPAAQARPQRIGARFRFNATVERHRAGAQPRLVRVAHAPHDARDEARRARASADELADDAAAGRRDAEPRTSTRSSSARRSASRPLLRRSALRLPLHAVLRLLGHRAAAPRRAAPRTSGRARR